MDQYSIIQRLGSGACGAVYLVRDAESKKLFALKKIEIDERKKTRAKDTLLKEANILSKLKHPHVVAFHDSFLDSAKEHVIIIQDYCDGGTLADRIQAALTKDSPFGEKLIMHWFVQIVMGVQYIHSQKVLHRDLKAENVFLTKKNIVKIGDFGISKILDNTIDVAKTVVGTPSYLSPELCQDIPYNSKSDMWAVGCVLYEMCTLKQPFDAQNLLRLFLRIINEKQEPLPDEYSQSLQELVDSLLEKSPDSRPSASAVLNKAFVRRHLACFISEKELQQQQQQHLKGTSDSSSRAVSPLAAKQSLRCSSSRSTGFKSSPRPLTPQQRAPDSRGSKVQRSKIPCRQGQQKSLSPCRLFTPAGKSSSSLPPSSPPSGPFPYSVGPCSPKSELPKLKQPKQTKPGCPSESPCDVAMISPRSERSHSHYPNTPPKQCSPLKARQHANTGNSPPDLSPRSPPFDFAQKAKTPLRPLSAGLELNGQKPARDGLKSRSEVRDSSYQPRLSGNFQCSVALEPVHSTGRKRVPCNWSPQKNPWDEPTSPGETEELMASDYSDDFDESDSEIEEDIPEESRVQKEDSSEGEVDYADDFEEYDDTEDLAAIVDLAREAQDVEESDDYFEDPEGHCYALVQSVDLVAAQEALLCSSLNVPRAQPSLPPLSDYSRSKPLE